MSTWRVAALGVALAAALGCGGTPPRAAAPPRAIGTSTAGEVAPRDSISVELHAPRRVAWIASTLGPAKPMIDLVLTNHGDAPADIANVRAHVEATREGIAFRCEDSIGPAHGAHEPVVLMPGSSIEIERPLDCALPLAGRYTVRVSASFGKGAWHAPRPVKTFSLNVIAPEHLEPRPIPSLPGVWAAVGASRVLVGESGIGSGRIAISIVNGGASEREMPKMRLSLRVFRRPSPVPCEDGPIEIHLPKRLASGDAYREPIDVSCLGLGVVGHYEVVARLMVDLPDQVVEQEVGRLRIDISDDPSRRMAPLP